MFLKSKTFRLILLLVILPLVAATVMAEIALGIIGKAQRHAVKDYVDLMRPGGITPGGLGPGGYLKENLNLYVTDGLGGRARWITNSKGFRNDREFSPQPPSGVLRIFSLGDSFTAGYRVGQKETFSALLEAWISRNYGPCEVLVAQVQDPITALYYLDRFGVKFHPDLVLLGLTLGNDLAQNYKDLDPHHGPYILTLAPGEVRIGLNKHPPKLDRPPWLERIPPEYLQPQTPLEQVVSHLGRWLRKRYLVRRLFQEKEPITSCGDRTPPMLFDANNGLGMYTDPPPPAIAEAFKRLDRVLEAFKIYCDRRGIILAVQIFPQRYQISPLDWQRAVAEYSVKPSRFDLMGPNKKIQAWCREQHIFLIDPTAAMAADYGRTGTNLYYPRGDMHWNRQGHRVFFECSRQAYGTLAARGFAAVRARDAGGLARKQAAQ
jgi:hypothetical protein